MRQLEIYKQQISEKDFLAQVIELAQLKGWRVYHTFEQKSYARRIGAGFPDLVLVRERVIWAELKREKGIPTNLQAEWIHALQEAKQEVYLWHPSDWEEIVRTLSRIEEVT